MTRLDVLIHYISYVCGNTQKQEVNEPKGERRTAAGAVSSPQYLQFYVSHYIDVKVKMSNRGKHRFCNTKKPFTQLQIKHCLTDSCDKHPVFVQQWKHALQLQPARCNLSHPEDTPVSKEKRCIWLIYDNIYQITWVWFFMTPFFYMQFHSVWYNLPKCIHFWSDHVAPCYSVAQFKIHLTLNCLRIVPMQVSLYFYHFWFVCVLLSKR